MRVFDGVFNTVRKKLYLLVVKPSGVLIIYLIY